MLGHKQPLLVVEAQRLDRDPVIFENSPMLYTASFLLLGLLRPASILGPASPSLVARSVEPAPGGESRVKDAA